MEGPEPGGWICWNGELFDHDARRRELASEGAVFRTRSDTEVYAHLLSRDEDAALGARHAQFALAWVTGLEDGGTPELLLARDAAGEKPLFFAQLGARLFFASTLDALVALAEPPLELDPDALSLYLSWGFVPAPFTIYRGIAKLAAGVALRVRRGGEVVPQAIPAAAPAEPADDPVAALEDALRNAARMRLESSDVPVGVFLSSGLDSLAVAAVLRDAADLRTFTVRSRDPANDESEAAARVATALGVRHDVIDPPDDDPQRWRDVLLRYGEPFGSASAVAVDAVARAAKEHVKVVLTGDGGDEALGGYPRHVLLRRLARFPRLPRTPGGGGTFLRRARRALELLSLDAADRYAQMYEVFGVWRGRLTPGDDGAAARDLIRRLWDGAPAADLGSMLGVDRRLELPDSHCVKVDVACMGNGVEPRSPWLDREVVRVCDALPAGSRIRGKTTKAVLRELLRRELPGGAAAEILARPKRGFATGFESALRTESARELLLGDALRRVPGLETGPVAEMLAEHRDGRGNHLFRLCTLVGLALFAAERLR
jgi:asparagine synthase (glutamine-hydrolysing)